MAKISKWEIRFKRIYNWKMPIIMLHERINRRSLFPASFFQMQAVRIRSFKIQNSTSQNCFVRNGYDLKWSTNWPRQLFFFPWKSCNLPISIQILRRCSILKLMQNKADKNKLQIWKFLRKKIKVELKEENFLDKNEITLKMTISPDTFCNE